MGCIRYNPTDANKHASSCLAKATFRPDPINPKGSDTFISERFSLIFQEPVSVTVQGRFAKPYRLVHGVQISLDEKNCHLIVTEYFEGAQSKPFYKVEFHHAKWFAHLIMLHHNNQATAQVVFNGKCATIHPPPITPLTSAHTDEIRTFGFYGLHLRTNRSFTLVEPNRTKTYTFDFDAQTPLQMTAGDIAMEKSLRFGSCDTKIGLTPTATRKNVLTSLARSNSTATSNRTRHETVSIPSSPSDSDCESEKVTVIQNAKRNDESTTTLSRNETEAANQIGVAGNSFWNDAPLPWQVIEPPSPCYVQMTFHTDRARSIFMAAFYRYQAKVRQRLAIGGNVTHLDFPEATEEDNN